MKSHINIGTLGHVDHGKTTLTAAISKVLSHKYSTGKAVEFSEIDSLPEERKRGITIRSAHVGYETETRSYNSLDIPGHRDFVKNAILGLTQMDYGILVLSGTDGVMEQTREHLLLARQIGVKKLAVFINKCDVVNDDELLDLVEMEVADTISHYGYTEDDYFIIRGSALVALNNPEDYSKEYGAQAILDMFKKIDEFPLPERDMDKSFMMSVEEVFSIKGRGTVITGTPSKGNISVGDKIEIYDKKKERPVETTVTGVQQFHKDIDTGVAGTNLGILVRGVDPEDVTRGNTLVKPKTYTRKIKVKAKIYLLTEKEGGRRNPIFNNYAPMVFLRNDDIKAKLKLETDDSMIMPGDDFECELDLMYPIFIESGDSFSIREGKSTVGSGRVL